MREKRHRERSKAITSPLSYQAEEILVAKNRNVSPLVLSFIYEPDNIALRDLGTLFGTFIVSDNHEDSSYIVNCLAAAAKKEYFINSRRSVEESFESTLHKINLTLGKLVRDGHINWMGKFHGSIIAIHDRNAYFSVTGNATILLLRDHTLSAISEGLSDPGAALHPLKTFTDISEGILLSEDKLILSTPELLELLPHALLEREASKLPLDRFAQLLKTALINERSAAATIIIDFAETAAENAGGALRMAKQVDSTEKDAAHSPLIENVWSSQAFRKNEILVAPQTDEAVASSTSPDAIKKEHIDERTGHIYIQADSSAPSPETETAFDRVMLIINEQVSFLFLKIKRQGARYATLFWQWLSISSSAGIQMLARWTTVAASSLLKGGLHIVRKIVLLVKNAFSEKTMSATIKNISFSKKTSNEDSSFQSIQTEKPSISIFSKLRHPNISLSLPQFSVQANISVFFSRGLSSLKTTLSRMIRSWQASSQKQKRLFVSGIAVLVLIGVGMTFFPFQPKEILVEKTEVINTPSPDLPIFSPRDEPLVKEVSGQEILFVSEDALPIQLTTLKGVPFAITKSSIINTETKATLSLPESASPILQASAMNDLSAIFIYGQDKKMYLYYLNAKSLVENIFPLPTDFTINDMGTYLTYLYAFDAKQGRILRFPRAEGGFGAPTEWLKEKVTFDENAAMSIDENILIGSKDTVFSFAKGKGGAISLSGTKTPVDIQDISIAKDGSFTILDRAEKRIVRFGKDGQLIGQYFNEQLRNGDNLAVSPDGNTAFIAIKEKILSFELQ